MLMLKAMTPSTRSSFRMASRPWAPAPGGDEAVTAAAVLRVGVPPALALQEERMGYKGQAEEEGYPSQAH